MKAKKMDDYLTSHDESRNYLIPIAQAARSGIIYIDPEFKVKLNEAAARVLFRLGSCWSVADHDFGGTETGKVWIWFQRDIK